LNRKRKRTPTSIELTREKHQGERKKQMEKRETER
jgi:hypothetical protein